MFRGAVVKQVTAKLRLKGAGSLPGGLAAGLRELAEAQQHLLDLSDLATELVHFLRRLPRLRNLLPQPANLRGDLLQELNERSCLQRA